jgi:RNA polymerase sigma-32 factor
MTARKPKQAAREEATAHTEEPAASDGTGGESKEDDDAAFEAELVDASEVPDVPPIDDAVLAVDHRPLPLRKSGGKSTLLARYDPLEAYMRDVQRYKLLTAEEEHAAAVKYFKDGDLEAAARLVTANLRLVVKIAYDYRRAHRQIPDLIQEGNVGLMQAVKKYDPYKGVKLSTYAAWWIRAYMLRYILNNARLVKLGTTQAQRKLFFNLRKEKAKLSAMGIEPTAEAIAERLDVTADEVTQMDRRLAAGDASLDSPLRSGEENAPSRLETLSGDGARIDDVLADNQMHALFRGRIAEFGKKLTGKDRRIFDARMLTEEPLTLQQLGDEFGVSRERVRQLEKRLHTKLREFLAAELGDDAMQA